MLKFFKPAPHLPEEQDAKKVAQSYRYWRLRIFVGMYTGYIFYYFSRKSFTFAMPALMNDLGFTKGDLGFLSSILAITYGFSKFLSGIVADRSNPRVFMAIGLIMTGLFNIFFGLSSSIFFFAIFWGLNGWFQGWGWPPCARLLTHWYSQKERGRWWGVWNTSHSIGGGAMTILAPLFAQLFGWRSAMLLPGAFCVLAGFFILNRLRDTPQSLGLPPIERFKNDYPEEKGGADEEQELSAKQILFDYVLKNRYIWLLAIAYFFVYVIRIGMNDWSYVYLVEKKNYSLITGGLCVFLFEAGGLFGSFIAGWLSDKVFNGKRGPVNALFSLGVIGAIGALWFSPIKLAHFDAVLLFVIGFLIFGPQMLIGMVAAEISHKKAAGTATGFIGWIAYGGAAAAGYPLGKLAEVWGWSGFFIAMAVCAGLATLLLFPLWSIKSHPKQAYQPAIKGSNLVDIRDPQTEKILSKEDVLTTDSKE